MNPTIFEIGVAIVIVAVCIASVVGIRAYMYGGSERRMRGMLTRAGVDPEVVMRGDNEDIIKEVRSRCRRCQTEDLCERWLSGKVVKGGNSFCPNARIFRNLARKTTRTG